MYVCMSQGRREITKNNRKGQGKMRINYSTLCSIGNEGRMAGWLDGWVGGCMGMGDKICCMVHDGRDG